MKAEIRELEIELIAENDHERDVLERLHRHREVRLKDGRSTDRSWPPDPRQTNIIICLPDPHDWGT